MRFPLHNQAQYIVGRKNKVSIYVVNPVKVYLEKVAMYIFAGHTMESVVDSRCHVHNCFTSPENCR